MTEPDSTFANNRCLSGLASKHAPLADGELDPGILVAAATGADHAVAVFIAALRRHRPPEREAAWLVP